MRKVEKLRNKNPNMKKLFWEVLNKMKKPRDLNDLEKRALIARVGFLDDEEREFYKSIFTQKNLTNEEKDRYGKLGLLDKYFIN